MKLLLLILLFNNFQYGQLAHLPGYYTIDNEEYQFKPCYEDEVRIIVQKDDIVLMIDYLDEKHDTKLHFTRLKTADVYDAVVRKNGIFYQLDLIAVSNDQINYIVEVFYKELVND